MWYKTCLPTVLVLFVSCDSGAPSPDLSAAPADMVETPDLTSPADMTLPRKCSSPAPIEYLESIQYTWLQAGGSSTPLSGGSLTPVAVRGDGVFVRSTDNTTLTTPERYTCSFTERDIDPETCTAPCCPSTARQPQLLSPLVYVDAKGWSMWVPGSCSYSIATAHYTAAISWVVTQPAH
jgi:hypothetical protein